MLHSILLIIHFFCAFWIVALVLLQRGKGAEAGAGFGAGASGTVFGARGATTALSRATAILAALFMITSLSLAYVGTHHATSSQQPARSAVAKARGTAVDACRHVTGGQCGTGRCGSLQRRHRPAVRRPPRAAHPRRANAGASSGGAPPANK